MISKIGCTRSWVFVLNLSNQIESVGFEYNDIFSVNVCFYKIKCVVTKIQHV